MRTTLDSTCWVSAPRRVRLPPHTLRMTTAGRIACSARQLVASIDGSPQEEEHGREFVGQVPGKALGVFQRRRRVDQPTEPGLESAAEHVETAPGQFAVLAAVPHVQAGLEDRLDLRAPGTVGVVFLQCLGAAEQVIDATLVQRVLVAPVHLPPVAHEHAGVVGPQHGGGIVEPAAGTDRIDRRVRRGVRPQPMTPAADAPSRSRPG